VPASCSSGQAGAIPAKRPSMLRVSTTVLASLLVVLTLASSAWAECAWVMCVVTAKSDPRFRGEVVRSWQPIRGTDTLQNCEELASEYQSKAAKNAMFSCFPDTMDPRGPKGR
jgi:hypothetical protein